MPNYITLSLMKKNATRNTKKTANISSGLNIETEAMTTGSRFTCLDVENSQRDVQTVASEADSE